MLIFARLVLLASLGFGSLLAQEVVPILAEERGPVLANQVVHSVEKSKQLVTGNGDISLMWDGGTILNFGKADFWGVVRGNITSAGHLRLTCKELEHPLLQQNIGLGTLTGKVSPRQDTRLETVSWIAYPQNLMVTELKNTGSLPLHFSTQVLDGPGTAGLPSDTGATADSTWIQVSPDFVDFQVGSRSLKKNRCSFIGSLAGLQILAADQTEPFLAWNPSASYVRNIGSLKITSNNAHGDSVQFTGEGDHRLIIQAGCIPQKGFTFSTWVNPSQHTPDGTILSAIASEKPDQYPYFRGFLVHLRDGKPEARLNYYTATGPEALPLNQWTEIKVVYEKQLLTLFVNGKQVAQADNPPASAQMGWDKATIRLGDPALPFKGCAPQAILRQRVLGTEVTCVDHVLSFTVDPGRTAQLLVALVSDRNTSEYVKVAQDLVNSNENQVKTLKSAHDKWWHDFWSKSYIEIPDKRIQENWYGSLYVLACCSRADCPPPGLWHNFITGMGVSWDGDYTLDYNYQAPFWAAYASNHLELADNYEPLLLDHMSRGVSIAQNAWRMDSMRQPQSLEQYIEQRNLTPPDPNLKAYKGIYLYTHLIPVPGWSNDYGTFWNQKSNALFCTVNMIQRWRLTRNLDYARKVYPFLKGTADFWDDYLVLKDGRYSALDDALCEGSGANTNPATTLSFIRLLYPSLIEMSEKLNVDAANRAKWHEVLDKLSPFTYVDAAKIGGLAHLDPAITGDKKVIRDCEAKGPDFPNSAFLLYHDHKQRGSSAGMNCTQTIFPGWTFGLESSEAERTAALNTVTFAAEWYDFNNDCTFYPAAAAIGYDPKEILDNLHALIETTEQPNFTIATGGGGTEDDAIVPGALFYMFLQSYQTNIHIFPNWPKDQDASFGNLPACGGFLISSQQRQGQISYVQIKSQAGEICHLCNPWPNVSVKISGSSNSTGSGPILNLITKAGDTLILTPLK